jgi:hypothetical protein
MALGVPSTPLSVGAGAQGAQTNPRPTDPATTGSDLGSVSGGNGGANGWSWEPNKMGEGIATATGNALGYTPPPPVQQAGGWTANRLAEASAPLREGFYGVAAMNGPALAQQAANNSLAAMGLANLSAGQQMNTRHANENYNLAMQGVGLERQGIDISRRDIDTKRARLGLDRTGLGVDRNYIDKMRDYANQALTQTLGGIARNEQFDKRDTSSGYTSRGSWFAPFHRQDLGRITDTANQNRAEANIAFGRENAGYDRDLARNDLSGQNIDLSYRDVEGEEARLSLTAQQLGLKEQELYTLLQQGLDNLGVSYQGNVYDLLAGLGVDPEFYGPMLMDALMYSNDPKMLALVGQIYATNTGRASTGQSPAAIPVPAQVG